MKILIFNCICCLVCIFASCCKNNVRQDVTDESQTRVSSGMKYVEADSLLPPLSIEQQEDVRQIKILYDYLRVEDNQYVLDISETEAAKIGVSDRIYRELVCSIEAGNKMIDEQITAGVDMEVLLPDK